MKTENFAVFPNFQLSKTPNSLAIPRIFEYCVIKCTWDMYNKFRDNREIRVKLGNPGGYENRKQRKREKGTYEEEYKTNKSNRKVKLIKCFSI